MKRHELETLNAELIDLLVSLHEQIDEKLDELAAAEEDEDGEPAEAGNEDLGENDED